MEPEQTAAEPPEERRASALVAIASVAVIAVLAAGSVVAWARLAGPAETRPAAVTLTDELPAGLPDGTAFAEVPPAIADAVEDPVVGAVRLDALPQDLDGCGDDMGVFSAEPRLESAFVTPGGAVVSLVGPSEQFAFPGDAQQGSGNGRVVCQASWQDGWVVEVSGMGPAGHAEQHGGGTGCCDAEGFATASATVAVPEDATWLVQDHGGYRLAYAVEGLPAVSVTWRFPERALSGRPPSSSVMFLNDRGAVLEERFVGF